MYNLFTPHAWDLRVGCQMLLLFQSTYETWHVLDPDPFIATVPSPRRHCSPPARSARIANVCRRNRHGRANRMRIQEERVGGTSILLLASSLIVPAEGLVAVIAPCIGVAHGPLWAIFGSWAASQRKLWPDLAKRGNLSPAVLERFEERGSPVLAFCPIWEALND